MAVSPELHRYCHSDADNAHHQCAATMLSHGQVDSPAIDPGFSIPIFAVEAIAPSSTTAIAVADYSLPPDRGPPALV